MSRKYLICHQKQKKCPFRILDIQLDVFGCNFYKQYWQVFNEGNSFGAKVLVNRACEWIKKEERRLDFISKGASKETIKMLENLEVGDMLFWTNRVIYVTLLEKPTEISQIARLKCRKSDGKVIEIPAYNLCKISSGTFYGEYFIEGVRKEKKVQELEYKTNLYGFRTEIERREDGYLLKIYGDSQREVDDFISLSLEQDFDISPYI
ncbi:MAG: hypothetical protein KGD58_05875 [Candidatus Lokiarchaeota archaeon]|nr:hypothetical protein [Candidatus Lokiarchaeota archaeon]